VAAFAATVAALALVVAAPAHQPVAHADVASRGGDFVPFTTSRTIYDSRSGAKIKAGATVSFNVLNKGGVPATGVSAVLLRVLAMAPTAGTWLSVYPYGTTRPGVSMVNVGPGETIGNTAVVRPGTNGQVTLFNAVGETHVTVDVQGYFTTSTGAANGGFVPLTQRRALDTTKTTIIPVNGTRTVDLAATGGVPAGASAVFAELTVPSSVTAVGSFVAAPTGVTAGTTPVINYDDRVNTASGAVLPLTTDGRITFTNKGSVAAHLLVDVMGYFSKTATAGAGLRPVTARLYNGSLAANATVDVQVGGVNGLPTRGIAGAVLSMQAGGGTSYGALRAWSTGGVEPGVAHTQYLASTHHRASVVIKPGTDGKVRIKNYGTAATQIYIDLEGWFSDQQTVIPTAPNTPVRVLQAKPQTGQSAATVEYAYVDNLGKVVVAHQQSPDNYFDVQYQTISGNEAFSGPPVLTHGAAGVVQVSAQYGDGGDVWASQQTASAAPTWTAFTDLGGSMAYAPAAANLTNGTTAVFGVDADGKLWVFVRTGTTPYWRNLGDQDLVGSPATATVRDGVQVFARTAAGAVKTVTFRDDLTVSAWSDLGGAVSDTPAAVTYPGYRVALFARATDGSVVTKKQDATGVFPADWTPTGQTGVTGAPAAVIDPVDGLTWVIARDDAGQIHLWAETSAGSGTFAPFTGWTNGTPTVVDPSVGLITAAGNQYWVIVYRSVNGTPYVVTKNQGFAARARSSAFTEHALPAKE
jgi:hypothetical protein